jgi:hypothetical protein
LPASAEHLPAAVPSEQPFEEANSTALPATVPQKNREATKANMSMMPTTKMKGKALCSALKNSCFFTKPPLPQNQNSENLNLAVLRPFQRRCLL